MQPLHRHFLRSPLPQDGRHLHGSEDCSVLQQLPNRQNTDGYKAFAIHRVATKQATQSHAAMKPPHTLCHYRLQKTIHLRHFSHSHIRNPHLCSFASLQPPAAKERLYAHLSNGYPRRATKVAHPIQPRSEDDAPYLQSQP